MKTDGWKVTMKYFQNVVDTVRDLMSASGEEQHYKNGMRKDPDGFMDIEWCETKVINSWNHLREEFQRANARKAIAPTQFNPMSTRGHCIMVLEVEMPNPDNPDIKLRGRVYICDLAGTEPAGDIVFAQYEKKNFDDGTFEYKYLGPHPDQKRTKELQEQGKKINLSLSEMSQFFMKMAEAVMKKKLTPGMSIPGCNSFFLCKYLKDTMLQARTYLFCAIRPEVEYLRYTFATLGFAKNASVVKLAPKKATVACSAAERKLMAELEAMKELVAQLQKQNSGSVAGGNSEDVIRDLQEKLAQKQQFLADEMGGGPPAVNEQQRMEYAKRGITLVGDESSNGGDSPFFINLDEDAFRSNRFMYMITKELTVFGNKCDIQPMSLAVVKNHCSVRFTGTALFLIGGKGDTYHNGNVLKEGQEVQLNMLDRVGMGDQLMLLRWPVKEDPGTSPITAEDAVNEFQDGIMRARESGGGSASHEEERRKLMEEREKWEKEKSELTVQRNEKAYQQAMASVDNAIMDLLPRIKEAKETVDLLNRVTMSFEVVLEKSNDGAVPKVKISVKNSNPKYSILIDPTEFLPKLSLLKDELMKLRAAIDAGRDYELPERHDPLYLMFDNDYLLGKYLHRVISRTIC
jgi:hypothetical protein